VSRSFFAPVLVFAAVLGVGDALMFVYLWSVQVEERAREVERIRDGFTAHLRRHSDAVKLLGREDAADAARWKQRVALLAEIVPALAASARFDAGGTLVHSASAGGEGLEVVPNPAAFRAALEGDTVAEDPRPGPDGGSIVTVWAPAEKGAVAAVFRADRLVADAVDALIGIDAPYVLEDSKGRVPARRGDETTVALDVPLLLPGLLWRLRVPEPESGRSRFLGLAWSVCILSAAMWAGFTLARRRSIRDSDALRAEAAKLEDLAGREKRERLRLATLLDSMHQGVLVYDAGGTAQAANEAGRRLLGAEPRFVTAEGMPYPSEKLPAARVLASGERAALDDLYLKQDGGNVPLSAVAAPLRSGEGAVDGAVVLYEDVSARREWEENVQDLNFSLFSLHRFATDAQKAKAEDDIVRLLKEQVQKALPVVGWNVFRKGAGSDKLRADRTTGLKGTKEETQLPVLCDETICPVLASGDPIDPRDRKERVQPCLGRISPGAVLCAPLRAGNKQIGVVHLELAVEEPDPTRVDLVFELIRSASGAIGSLRLFELLNEAAIRDPLTSLYNRRHFDEVARSAVANAKRHLRPMGVLMIDIDHFKQFNDRHGHDAGDVVLREFARALQATGRQSDVMVRYGGEEFAVLLPETALGAARIAAERILLAARELRLPIPGLERGHVTVSIGVAAYPEHGDTPEGLVKAADVALYQAKTGGRNRIVSMHSTNPPTAKLTEA
jgi:diguanylate cyclase (GGDEF)-like protein